MGLQVKKQEIQKIFSKLEIITTQNNHHVRGFITINNKKVIPIYYSHGKGDLPGRVPDKFRKSLRLEVDEFRLLVQCPLKKEEYYEILKKRLAIS